MLGSGICFFGVPPARDGAALSIYGVAGMIVLCLFGGDAHGKNRIHPGHPEQFKYTWTCSGDNHPDVSIPAVDVVTDDSTQTGGIHVRNISPAREY
jgi:hypothetical protein